MAIRLSGMASGLDTDTIIKGIVDAQKLKDKRVSDKSQILEWKQEKLKELNTKLYKLYAEDLTKLRLQSGYTTKKVTSSNESIVSVSGTNSATGGTHSVEVKALASAQYITGDTIKNSNAQSKLVGDLGMTEGAVITIETASGGKKDIVIDSTMTLSAFATKCKDAGINASYDSVQKRLFYSSKESGADNWFTISEKSTGQLSKLGLSEIIRNEKDGTVSTTNDDIKIVNASSSEVVYNGAILTGNTNTIAVNGLTLELKGVTNGQSVNISVTNDTQAIYDSIKNFVTNYNSILKELNTLYYADSSKGYDPLSDDEKESMTDDEIAKWESKIKDSVIRRDSTVGNLISAMKSAIMTPVTTSDGKTYTLASFGIGTSSDYTEKGLLHINGDKDDSTFASLTDKLMAALESNPDTVADVMSKTVKNLYDAVDTKIKAIPNVRSAFTFYNDKLMTNQQTEYKKKITLLEKKLIELENKYYKQFSAMETAMAKMQSQSNALSGMLGTGQ